MQNGTVSLEGSLAVSYKTKHNLTIWSSSHGPWYHPKKLKALSTLNLNMDVAALLRMAKTWKQPICPSLGIWISSDTSSNSILFCAKEKWAIKIWRCGGNLKWKKLWKGCAIPTIWPSRTAILWRIKRLVIARGWGVGSGWIGRTQNF